MTTPLLEPVLHQPQNPTHVLARWGDLVLDVFLKPPSLREMEDIRHVYEHPDTPERFGLLVVLSPSLRTAPEANVRRAINAQLRRYQARILAYTVVVELDGMLGTAARAVVQGMHMMEQWTFPVTVVESVAVGARFLCRHLPSREGLTEHALQGAVEKVRRRGAAA